MFNYCRLVQNRRLIIYFICILFIKHECILYPTTGSYATSVLHAAILPGLFNFSYINFKIRAVDDTNSVKKVSSYFLPMILGSYVSTNPTYKLITIQTQVSSYSIASFLVKGIPPRLESWKALLQTIPVGSLQLASGSEIPEPGAI